jgi:HAD superfamily hydrolase (TIGR01509 family)
VSHASPPIRALIFDFDGVMVDSERVEADRIIEVLGTWGADVGYRDFGHLFGTVDAEREWDELVGGWCGRTAAELHREIHPAVTPLKDALPLMPGVRELLDLAHERGLPVGLGTGNTLANLRRRLGRHGVFGRFDAIVTREEVVSGKPAPDIYVEVARRLGVPAPACLVLEDSVPGCQAALAADMRVIACPTAVTGHCSFPEGAKVVSSLLQVAL